LTTGLDFFVKKETAESLFECRDDMIIV